MSCLKINKANLTDTVSYAKDLKHNLFLAYTSLCNFKVHAQSNCSNWVNSYWQRFINQTNVKRSDYEYTYVKDGKEYTACHETDYEDAVETAARAIVQQKVDEYKGYTTDMTKVIYDYWLTMVDIYTAFYKVQGFLEEYEGHEVGSLEDYFKSSFDKHNNLNYEDFDYKFDYEKDEEGNESQKLSVLINEVYGNLDETAVAFVTNIQAKVDTAYVMVSKLVNDKDFQKLSPAEQRAVVAQTLKDINDSADKQTEDYRKRGLFSATSMEEIADRYEKDTGVKYDAERVAEEAKYFRARAGFDDDDELNDLVGTGAAAVTGLGVYNFAQKNGAITDEELEKDGYGYLAEGRKNAKEGKIFDEEGNVDDEKLIEPEGEQPPEGETPPGGNPPKDPTPPKTPSTPDKPPQEPEPPADPDIKDPPQEIIPDNRTNPVTEDPIPDPPGLDNRMTSETADRLAEERFYDQFSPEQLADYRNNQKAEFESLFAKDDKSDLIDFFNESGYTLSDAKVLAENKELGLAAFLAAKQSADMADLSRSIAQSANMDMSLFDTKYDNIPSYNDLVSGDTNAFISNPNLDPKVSSARQAMNTAKVQYDKAVDTANKSIETANNNKAKLEAVKQEIIKKSGNDSSKWSEEDIKKYNDAVSEYNDSVKQANQDVSNAQNAKNEFDNSKTEYENCKDEYYENVKKEALENRRLSEGDGDSGELPDQEPPVGENPDYDVLDDGGVGTDDTGMGFGKPTNEGNGAPESVPTPTDDSGSHIGVDESGTGLGFRSDSPSALSDESENDFANENNSEYIYHDGSETKVTETGLGF